jgi:predicted transcriptional regulator
VTQNTQQVPDSRTTASQSTTETAEKGQSKPKLSEETFEKVAKIMEERKKDRMKTLTRNLEVCDLLDMRNPQSVAEYAP